MKQKLIEELIPLMKERKYKKNKQTWYKETDHIVVLFNVQNSQFGNEYYINLGIIIKKLLKEKQTFCISNCHIQERISEKNKYGQYYSGEFMMEVLKLWEERYGNITQLRIRAIEGKLPVQSTGEAITFLTTVRLA